jgi:hypothetical protein
VTTTMSCVKRASRTTSLSRKLHYPTDKLTSFPFSPPPPPTFFLLSNPSIDHRAAHTILHTTALYYSTLHDTLRHYTTHTILHCTIPHTILHYTIHHCSYELLDEMMDFGCVPSLYSITQHSDTVSPLYSIIFPIRAKVRHTFHNLTAFTASQRVPPTYIIRILPTTQTDQSLLSSVTPDC